MSDTSINTNPISYAVLKSKSLQMIPSSITCFALNYVTHRLLLCNKDKVFLYDLINNHILRKFNYAKELSRAYDNEIEIKSADAIILNNLWITLANKKSFLFFNDKLEFSRIYSSSPNPLLNIQVLQRTNDLLTIREDRKAIKVWKFEVIDNLTSEKKTLERSSDLENRQDKDKKKPPNMSTNRDKGEGKDDGDAERQEKQRRLKELGLSFEVNVFMRKQLHIPQNRAIVKMSFSEELKTIAIALDSMEVMMFNTMSGDHMQTLSFAMDKEVGLTSHVSIDQEILYYCDERRMVMYDLVAGEEIANQQCAFQYKIASFHAERANSNGGVYVLTSDQKIHAYSFTSKKILWTEELSQFGGDGQPHGLLATESTSRGFKPSLTFNIEAKNAMEANEVARRENTLKDAFFKNRYKMATDLGAKGLTTLFICKPGYIYVFDAMSSGKIVYNSPMSIYKMDTSYQTNEPKTLASKAEIDEVQVRLEFRDHTTSDYNLRNFIRNPKKPVQNLVALWKQSTYEHNPNNEPVEELKAAPVLEVHTMLEEKMFVVITPNYIHVVSLRANRMLSQSMPLSDVTACLAICLSFETFGNYYVILGTKKGTIVILECDFTLRTVNVLKHMPRHTGVLALRHLKESNHLLSVGTEGDIFLYTFTKPNDLNVFPTQQFHRLIWNQVTAVAFFSDKEIIAGLDNGVIQYAKFSWKSERNVDSRLFEYHMSAIRQIIVPPDTEGMFIACCDENVISCWQIGESIPLKIFRMADPIVSMFTNKNPLQSQLDLYIALENMIIKIDYDHGSSCTPISKDDEIDWNEGLFYRSKYCARAIREGKTANPLLQKLVDKLQEQKKSQGAHLSELPQLNKFLYQNTRYSNLKSLEVDHIQYVNTSAQLKRSQMPTLDLMLSGFYQRKVAGEPLISKTDIKVEKKAEKSGSLASLLVTTLKKYPTIRNMMIEKQKAKEREEMHKNVVLLLNITYKGEDNLEQQYKFLEESYQIKRESLDEAYLRRAKILFYKKPVNSPRFDMASTSQDFQFQTPRKDYKPNATGNKNVFKLPQLESDKKLMSPDAGSLTERSKLTNYNNKPSKVKVPKIKHFKNYSEDLEKQMMKQPTAPTLESIRGLTKQNEFVQRPLADTGYKSYSATKGGPSTLKLNLNFNFSPSPKLPAVLTSQTTRNQHNEEKLGIGQEQGDSTVRAPFFVTSRADLNRDAFIIEYKSTKSTSIPNITSLFSNTFSGGDFPKRKTKDFVGLHSRGFQAKENVDMFNHVLRLLLKNHYLLKAKANSGKTHEGSSSPVKRPELPSYVSEDDDLEYVPIEIKQYILEVSQQEMNVLDNVVSMYEMRTGQKINAEQTSRYAPDQLEEEMEKENALLEQILQKINEHGIESIGLNQMIKFKQIMRRRVETFSHLQAFIEVSGLLRTNTVTPSDIKLKQELIRTFHKVKDIADLRAACFPGQLSPKLVTSASTAYGTILNSADKPWMQGNIGLREAKTMLVSIKKSIENVAMLEGSSSAFDRHLTGPSSPRNGDTLKNIELSSPRATDEGASGAGTTTRRGLKAFTTVPKALQVIKSWGELINANKDISAKPVFSGNKLKRRNSLTGSTNEIKMIYKVLKRFEEDKPGSGSPRSRASRPRSREEGMSKMDGILGIDERVKGKKVMTEEEDNTKKIERAWKEKDFTYLRTFLSQKNNAVVEGKKDTETGLETEGNEAKGASKKKKKKRNPNINTSSGSVVTTTGVKKKKEEEDLMAKLRDGFYEQMAKEEYLINEKGENEEEEDSDDEEDVKGPLEARKLELLNHPTKETIRKTLKYQLQNSIGSPRNGQTGSQLSNDLKLMTTMSATGTPQATSTSIKEKVPSARTDVRRNSEIFQVGNRGSTLKINKRNNSVFTKEKLIDDMMQQQADNPGVPVQRVTKRKKPGLKSKYDLGEIEIEAFTQGEETKTITFGSRMETGSVTNRTKETEETPLVEEKRRVRKEDPKKKIVEITEKTELSKTESKVTESDFEGHRKKKISFAESVRKSRQDESQEMNLEKSEEDGKKKGKLTKSGVNNKYRGASFANHSAKKVSLLVKGEDRNRMSGDGTQTKESPTMSANSTPKGRSNFAPIDTQSRKNVQKMSRFAAEKEAARNKDEESDDEEEYDDRSNGRETVGSPESGLHQAYTDLKIGSEDGRMTEDAVTLKDSKSRGDLPESQMPSIAEKLDRVGAPKLPKQRSKRSMKKKVTAAGKQAVAANAEENKDGMSKEGQDAVIESSNRIEDGVEEGKEGSVKVRNRVNRGSEEEDDDDVTVFKQNRHSLKPRALEKEQIEDILDNPLKLFQVVMNATEVDEETKLDLFFYGNRKEALREFVKEVEDAIEHNIIKNNECSDQLAEFFDTKLNNLLVTKPTQIHHPASETAFFRKHTFPSNAQGNYDHEDAPQSYMKYRSSLESEAENSRRIAFQYQQTLLNNIKASAQSNCSLISQANMGPKSVLKQGQIILSPTAFETLVQHKDEILLDPNWTHQKEDEEDSAIKRKILDKEEQEEVNLLERLRRIRMILTELRDADSDEFERLMRLFGENKKLYNLVMKELEAREKIKINVLQPDE